MDDNALYWIVELSINDGKQHEFEKLAKEMSDMVRRSELGLATMNDSSRIRETNVR